MTSKRTDRILLTITHDQPERPTAALIEQTAAVIRSALSFAGISADVTAEAFPEEHADGWWCVGQEAEHWPDTGPRPEDAVPGDVIECGHCGARMVRTAEGWEEE
jgi:hypothetical protein